MYTYSKSILARHTQNLDLPMNFVYSSIRNDPHLNSIHCSACTQTNPFRRQFMLLSKFMFKQSVRRNIRHIEVISEEPTIIQCLRQVINKHTPTRNQHNSYMYKYSVEAQYTQYITRNGKYLTCQKA